MKILVTGGAGFVGSHLVDRLMDKGNILTVYDNLSSGKKEFLKEHFEKENFRFVEGDLLNFDKVKSSIKGQEIVFHLAANPDVRDSLKNPEVDLKQGTMATYNVLEAMRSEGVKNIVFSSSSVVYGEARTIPTPEDYGPLAPISLYGASKLASEGLITAYCHTFGMNSWIFRFANIVGKRGTHGILVDFLGKLEKDPRKLEILGNGEQKKSYLLVEECVEGILYTFENSREKVNIFNLGSQDNIRISRIAEILVEEMALKNVKFEYTEGRRGWPGDVPLMMLNVKKINQLGWKAKYSSEEVIKRAVRDLICKR
jgi:UDP-glucose 4-epimerase